MNISDFAQIAIFFVILFGLALPLGKYMSLVYEGKPGTGLAVLQHLEKLVYKGSGIKPEEEMTWVGYASALMHFSLIGFVFVYLIQRMQCFLPLNPENLSAVTPDSAFNTTVSFITNTNWQGYGGESTMSYLTQMLALNVQNFVSAAVGMAVLVAFIRGLIRHQSETIGNFWSDLVRSTVHILLPLSLILSILLVSQGCIQNFSNYVQINPIETSAGQSKIAMGPVASQVAIKQLGTNGGGFFNANSCHPFENPTPLSNLFEMISIILIPAALCFTFGYMVKNLRQGLALLSVMTVIFIAFLSLCLWSEFTYPSMEGKETRFGIVNSVLWATLTTAASNGSVNCMHDSLSPLGGLVPMVLMQLGEVIFGGVGSGLYGMLVFALVTVFIAGLMVGRTPEYLGKKIESFEIKMSSLVLLIPAFAVLIGTAVAVSVEPGRTSVLNPSMHGFSEILYAFSSAGNNNGSAFAGLNANTPFYNLSLAVAMFLARYWLAIPVLAIAGSLAKKKTVPTSSGTIPTTGLLFNSFLICIVLIFGALTFIPALALGPVVEHLHMVFGAK